MIVFVTTPIQLEQAFTDWMDESQGNDREIIHKVFQAFMASSEAKIFHTVTGLISFPYPKWQRLFEQWRDAEISRNPEHLEKIHYWTRRVSELIGSDWGVKHKLTVMDCLDENDDFNPSHSKDLLDPLVR